MDSRFLKGVFSAVLAGVIQASLLAGPYGLKANWILAGVSAYAFVVPGFFVYAAVSLIASVTLYAISGFAVPSYAVFAALIFAYALRRFFPWQPLPGYSIALFAATFVPYAIVDPRFIALHPYLVATEAVCTAVLGIVLHALFTRLYDETGRYPS